MHLRNLRYYFFTITLVLFLVPGVCSTAQSDSKIIIPSKSLPDTTPWDLTRLSEAPVFEWSDKTGPVWSLYYKGRNYNSHPTRVFAYYASPSTLKKQESDTKRYPAVVLVHGGGGTAFKEWTELWARRGYAAIAMDLAGCGPQRKRLEDGGPGQGDDEKFGSIDKQPQEQWTYHSAANVILAHSLIQSFKQVDANRTAITGISWGGYLTCIVAGLDSRFKAAVPVYGCGFLHENSVWLGRFSKMTPQQKSRWVSLWDPSMYIGSATMPVFFVNGTNDFAYPLDSYAKTYSLVKSARNYRITVKMPHGHQAGWAPGEIGRFIDQYLMGGVALPRIEKPKLVNGTLKAVVNSTSPVVLAEAHYTTGKTPINKLDWISTSGLVDGKNIIVSGIPEDVTICFLTVKDQLGAVVSSELVFADSLD